MLHNLSVNQVQRKKILTRGDLVKELEKVLFELKEREHFASLRVLTLDSFCETDNPYLKQTLLGDLATNPAEVLRDQSQVDKKEIAALIEALFLLNVKSNHTLNVINASFTEIEKKADSVKNVLGEILSTIPKSNNKTARVKLDDSNVATLRQAIGELMQSENFEKIKSLNIETFWDKNASSCSVLSNMNWQQLCETPTSAIFNLPHFGKSRLKQLLKSIEQAKSSSNLQSAEGKSEISSNDILTAENAIKEGIEEIRQKNQNTNSSLAEALSAASSHALTASYLCQSIIQRRVGQLLGVTESRISQLLNEASKKIVESIMKTDPQIIEKLEFRLCSPACSEETLQKVLGLSDLSEGALKLIRIIVKALGASNPTYKGSAIKFHWTKRNSKFQGLVAGLLKELPLSTKKFSLRLEEVLVGSTASHILEALPPAAYYLRKKDYWYLDHEQALIEVLRSSKEPMTAQQITALFETGPRQMRYLLQNSSKIVRIGKNNGRRYTVEYKDP